ncbi:MAG: hypothetical protein WCD70_15295 [Alphaproteobacteria bacterium]
MEKVGMYGKWREKIFLEPECEGIPVYAALSLCNVEMCHFRYPSSFGWKDVGPLNRKVVTFPDIVIDSHSADIPTLMKPTFTMLWNAFGFTKCDMYDGQEKWTGR